MSSQTPNTIFYPSPPWEPGIRLPKVHGHSLATLHVLNLFPRLSLPSS